MFTDPFWCVGIDETIASPKDQLPDRIASVPGNHPTTALDFYVSVLEEFLGPNEPYTPASPSWVSRESLAEQNNPSGSRMLEKSAPAFLPRVFYSDVFNDMDPADFTYLQSKHALTLPSAELRNKILHGYIKWFHPLLPLLDLPKFMHQAVVGDDRNFPSPLLYQSVMFAGSAFLEIHDIRAAGYSSASELRHALFQKAKLLYDFDTESDALTETQALLLLTTWYAPESGKDPWYWLSLALSAAHRAGLNYESKSNIWTNYDKPLRRRVWWCLYIRDRMIALGVRKSHQVRRSDYKIDEPQVEDLKTTFESNTVTVINLVLGPCAALLKAEYWTELGNIYVRHVKLAHCIGAILDHIYQDSWALLDAPTEYFTLAPRRTITMESVHRCKAALMEWATGISLKPTFRTASYLNDSGAIDLDATILFHHNFLCMTYRTSLLALYGPIARAQMDSPGEVQPLRWLHNIAVDITMTLNDLRNSGLLSCLPGTAVTLVLFAAANHCHNSVSKDCDETARSLSSGGAHFDFDLSVAKETVTAFDSFEIWGAQVLLDD
ncbi:fungal-specific transcription factor domain-containing protein [Aspergillus navahoensis]